MQMSEFFLTVFWIATIGIVWFYTDVVKHNLSLFNILEATQVRYASFVKQNPYKYFPDFVFENTKHCSRVVRFLASLQACPYCLLFWLSVIGATLTMSVQMTAPVYVCSLVIMYGVRLIQVRA